MANESLYTRLDEMIVVVNWERESGYEQKETRFIYYKWIPCTSLPDIFSSINGN